jgi:small subunit ribosomal protein S20e
MSTMHVPVDAAKKTSKPGLDESVQPTYHKIRITLSSLSVKKLENVCKQLIDRAHAQRLDMRGPIRMPTKKLHITTRKSPCGEGSKTWDHFEMKIHKRIVDLLSPSEIVKQIASISLEPGVEVEVTIVGKPL